MLISLLVRVCLTKVEWPNATSTKILTHPIYVESGQTLAVLKKIEVN